MNELESVAARLLLEAENLLQRLEEDPDCRIKWICEKESLEATVEEARGILWPQ